MQYNITPAFFLINMLTGIVDAYAAGRLGSEHYNLCQW